MRLATLQSTVWRRLYTEGRSNYLSSSKLGMCLRLTQDQVRLRPFLTMWGGPSSEVRKELDRQPIGATLNLPQEAP